MRFRFDEVAHAYTLDGVILPSVTRIIKPLSGYGAVPEAVLAKAAARGNAVHKATELADAGTLDRATVDARIAGYVTAYDAFVRLHEPDWELVEVPMYHPVQLFAGTEDRFGSLTWQGTRVTALVDLKTTAKVERSVPAQLAGYLDILRGNEIECDRAFVLQLKSDATFGLHPVEPDHAMFEVCLAHHRAQSRINAWRDTNL